MIMPHSRWTNTTKGQIVLRHMEQGVVHSNATRHDIANVPIRQRFIIGKWVKRQGAVAARISATAQRYTFKRENKRPEAQLRGISSIAPPSKRGGADRGYKLLNKSIYACVEKGRPKNSSTNSEAGLLPAEPSTTSRYCLATSVLRIPSSSKRLNRSVAIASDH